MLVKNFHKIPSYLALIVGYIIIRAAVKIKDVVMSSIKGKFDLIGYSKSLWKLTSENFDGPSGTF